MAGTKTLDAIVSIYDFGGKVDGVTDDSAAFKSMIAYCGTTGATGILPPGVCTISSIGLTVTGAANKPFTIRGAGVGATTLKRIGAGYGLLYFTAFNGVGLEHMTIDGNYTGTQAGLTSNGTVVFQNSNDNFLQNVDVLNPYRVAVMCYNDHQITPSKVYKGFVADRVRILGIASTVAVGQAPSAFILADMNYSRISNCHIENIGLYGYEFKNDCTGTQIVNCVAVNTYNPIIYGGDGVQTSLGYVKKSSVENIIIIKPTSGCGVYIGRASDNMLRNISIDMTGVTTKNLAVYIAGNSNNNSITGVDVKNRIYELCTIRAASHNNVIEFTNITGNLTDYAGMSPIESDCTYNMVVFHNHYRGSAMFSAALRSGAANNASKNIYIDHTDNIRIN